MSTCNQRYKNSNLIKANENKFNIFNNFLQSNLLTNSYSKQIVTLSENEFTMIGNNISLMSASVMKCSNNRSLNNKNLINGYNKKSKFI